MATLRITKRSVDAMKAGETLFDDALRGFMVRARGTSKTYGVKYSAGGRQRIYTLGRHGVMTPDEARTAAIAVLARVAHGEDPQAAKSVERHRGRHTFADVAKLYIEEHARPSKKVRSLAEDERLLRLHLNPAIGTLDIEAVAKADFLALKTRMKERPIAFNRARTLASAIYSFAIEREICRTANPLQFVGGYAEKNRERFISAAEYGRLFAALNASEKLEHPSVLACIRLLALTGARLSEILTLKWDWVDLEHAALRLPDSKTGAKVISLPAPARQILAGIPRVSAFVLPGANLAAPFVGIQRPWRRIRARASLNDLRIHDLRHGFASLAVASGESLKLVGAALGHRQSSTTDRYAHLSTDPVLALADRTAAKIMTSVRLQTTEAPKLKEAS